MTQALTDLFGEKRIKISSNPLLEGICNHLLQIIQRDPDVLNGDTVGEIDRKLLLAIWFEEGLSQILTGDQKEKFIEWAMDPKRCPDPDAVSRARRYLLSNDLIRLPQKAILQAEYHKQRIQESVKH